MAKLCGCESVSGVPALSCSPSTCPEVLLCVTRGVCRLPPSGSCTNPAKTRHGCEIFPLLLARLELHTRGAGSQHIPSCVTDRNSCRAGQSCLPFHPAPPRFKSECSALCLHSWPLLPSAVPGLLLAPSPTVVWHRKIPCLQECFPYPQLPAPFSFPFLTNFLGNFQNSCHSLQGLITKTFTLLSPP